VTETTFDPSILKFGRRPQKYDARDWQLKEFITPSVRRKALSVTQQEWGVARILNQGATNHCVGYAWACFGISLPVFQNWDEMHGENIYYAAKYIDGEPGGEGGSYTRSGVQAFMQFGKLKDSSYAWAANVDEVVTWVLAVGPVITGTAWYDGMYQHNNGLVKVGGSYVGGHEWAITGADTVKQLFKCTNSWGLGYGVNGQFYLSFKDYDFLLRNYGDAVTATEVSVAPDPKRLRLMLGEKELWFKDVQIVSR
jgi:hypothetical protein